MTINQDFGKLIAEYGISEVLRELRAGLMHLSCQREDEGDKRRSNGLYLCEERIQDVRKLVGDYDLEQVINDSVKRYKS